MSGSSGAALSHKDRSEKIALFRYQLVRAVADDLTPMSAGRWSAHWPGSTLALRRDGARPEGHHRPVDQAVALWRVRRPQAARPDPGFGHRAGGALWPRPPSERTVLMPHATQVCVDSDSAELLRRVGEGDERALAELYERFAASVYGFVSRRVSDRDVAEEVCADVWLGCWRSARSFRGDSRVLTWLLGIATRQVHTHTRRKRLPAVSLDSVGDTLVDTGPDPADAAISQAGSEEITNAMERLPEDLYEVIVLAWLHNLPYGEISEVVGVPVGTVKSRVSRARRLLREEIGERHG